jgi:hypothetical protein
VESDFHRHAHCNEYGEFLQSATRAGAEGSITPEYIDYGRLPIGGIATQTASLRNTGTVPLTIPNVVLQGSAMFSLISPAAFSVTVAPQQTVTLSVRFGPSDAEGDYSATFVVNVNELQHPLGLTVRARVP